MNGVNGLAQAATDAGKEMSALVHVRDTDGRASAEAPIVTPLPEQETRVSTQEPKLDAMRNPSSFSPDPKRAVKTWRWRLVLEGGRELRVYGQDEAEAVSKVPLTLPKQRRIFTKHGEQLAPTSEHEPTPKVTYVELCGCVYEDGEVNFGGEQGSSFEDYRRAPGA